MQNSLYSQDSLVHINNDSLILSSSSDNGSSSLHSYPINEMATVFHTVFFILGLIFNCSTILVIIKGQKFSKKIQIQLTNLAVADLLSALFVFMGNSSERFITTSFSNNDALCKTIKYISTVPYFASLLCHVAIAIERLVAVYFPFRMRNYTRPKVILVNVLIWIVAAALQADYLYLAHVYPHPTKPDRYLCYVAFGSSLTYKLSPYLGLKLILPSSTICIAYGMIVAKLRKRKKIRRSNQSYSKAMNTKVVSMLAANGIITVLIWTPYFAFMSIIQHGVVIDNSDLIAELLFYLILVNCFITPIIYFIFSKAFRTDLAELFCLIKPTPVNAFKFPHSKASISLRRSSTNSGVTVIDEATSKAQSSPVGFLSATTAVTISNISCTVD